MLYQNALHAKSYQRCAIPPAPFIELIIPRLTPNELKVFDTMDAATCAQIMRKNLVLEYIKQVNYDTYSSNTLKDQMQALVLASAELMLDSVTELAYPALSAAYELDARHEAVLRA